MDCIKFIQIEIKNAADLDCIFWILNTYLDEVTGDFKLCVKPLISPP